MGWMLVWKCPHYVILNMCGVCLYHPPLSQIMYEYSSEVNAGQGLFPNRVWMRLPYTVGQQEREELALWLWLVSRHLHWEPESKTFTHKHSPGCWGIAWKTKGHSRQLTRIVQNRKSRNRQTYFLEGIFFMNSPVLDMSLGIYPCVHRHQGDQKLHGKERRK